ncbi:MAG TPA: transglycosylase family protein [Longimicrobiales bacterium]
MRKFITGAATVIAAFVGLAPAADAHRTSVGHHAVQEEVREKYVDLRYAAKKADLRVGKKLAPERSARMHGIYIRRLRAKLASYRAAKAAVAVPGVLRRIAACESGGDPGAVSPGGHYRGKYQFDYGTWASVGGSGDPAAAPEAEQDRRALLLYRRRGTGPWPVCGRRAVG